MERARNVGCALQTVDNIVSYMSLSSVRYKALRYVLRTRIQVFQRPPRNAELLLEKVRTDSDSGRLETRTKVHSESTWYGRLGRDRDLAEL